MEMGQLHVITRAMSNSGTCQRPRPISGFCFALQIAVHAIKHTPLSFAPRNLIGPLAGDASKRIRLSPFLHRQFCTKNKAKTIVNTANCMALQAHLR